MKIIKFIRHYHKLESPYLDGRNISYQAFVELSLGKVDPSINADLADEARKIYAKDAFANTELILTSPLKRTEETATVLKSVFNIDAPIKVNKSLAEMFWNPASMISEGGFLTALSENKLDLKEARVKHFLDGTAPKTLDDGLNQLRGLEEELTEYQQQKILCVTHSFFLKLLKLYFVDNKRMCEDFTKDLLLKTKSMVFETFL